MRGAIAGDAVILALSRFRVQNGLEQEVSDAFVGRPRRVEGASGFLGLEVFREADDPRAFLLFTRWADRAAFERWHKSPEHHASHALMPRGLKLDPAGTELVVAERIPGAASAGELLADCASTVAALEEQRALSEQLQVLNADLAMLSRENVRLAAEAERVQRESRDAHWHIQKISEVLPMCLECRRVQTGPDVWEDVATYLTRHSQFLSHGYCSSCAARLAEEAGDEPG
jgi:heme-degrading monooxygenase HmoA